MTAAAAESLFLARAPLRREPIPLAEKPLRMLERQARIDLRRAAIARANPDAREACAVLEQLEDELGDMSYRRTAELELAESILMWSDDGERLNDLAHLMKACHSTGCYGRYRPEDQLITAWDQKCADLHLCPHEARQNQRRLAKRYVPAIRSWLEAKPGRRRVFYGVFTVPNAPAGGLREAKVAAFQRFAAWYRLERPVTAAERRRYGWSARKRTMAHWLAGEAHGRDRGIHGAMIHQEDPLSARGDWNVHLNVLFLVEGPFHFAEVRATWGHDVELRAIDGDVESLTRQLTELVKYSAKMTAPSNSTRGPRTAQQRRVECPEQGAKLLAPPLIEWGPDRLREWWWAQKKLRRTRTYGCLFNVTKPEPIDMDLVEWMGRIEWAGTAYRVGSVPEDKFPSWRTRHTPPEAPSRLARAPP